MSRAPHIIVVDDEPDLRDSVASYLRIHGFHTSEADGAAALDALLLERRADAILLDVNMPGEDGFSIARRLRDKHDAAIIMLTARTDLIDRVVGLELGADDYVGKPFELRELLARVRAVLRRSERLAAPGTAAVEQSSYRTDLWVQERGMMVRVPVESIEMIRADRDYVTLHGPQRSYMLRSTMDALEAVLDPAQLPRVHRSAFVRLELVRDFRKTPRGGRIILANGLALSVGPRYLAGVIERLGLHQG